MFKWLKNLFSSKRGDIDIEETVEELYQQLEEQKALVAALPAPAPVVQPQTVQISLQDLIKDIERAMNEGMDMEGGIVLPFTTAENYSQVQYEMESVNIESEHWSDKDFIEHLLGYLQQGYNFDGLTELYKKAQAGKDLSAMESKQLKDWYTLVNVDIVYDV